jgi:hypothetical protein
MALRSPVPRHRSPHRSRACVGVCIADFAGMDAEVLLKALEVLQAQGLAELYRSPGGSLDETGVKFKAR